MSFYGLKFWFSAWIVGLCAFHQNRLVVDFSHSYQVQFDLGVAVFARPEVEGRRIDLIDQRHCVPEPGQVNSFYIALARVTCFYPNVIKLRRMKVTEFRRPLLTTVSADHASKFPRRETSGAHQISITALSRTLSSLKEAELRLAAAVGTSAVAACKFATNKRDSSVQ